MFSAILFKFLFIDSAECIMSYCDDSRCAEAQVLLLPLSQMEPIVRPCLPLPPPLLLIRLQQDVFGSKRFRLKCCTWLCLWYHNAHSALTAAQMGHVSN